MDENTTFEPGDFRNLLPRFKAQALRANQGLVSVLRQIGEARGVTPAQIALAWMLEKRPWIVPIPGTTKLHRLEENTGAANVELSPDDVREIEDAVSEVEIQGARYPEELQRRVGR
jgi:aryl-alcohol dehydrogenase-like predicted oxidoreductase